MHGEYKMPGGKLVVVDLDVVDERIAQVQVSGDFFLEPDAALATINAALCGQLANAEMGTLAACIGHALDSKVSMYGVSPEAIAVAVRRAIDGVGA